MFHTAVLTFYFFIEGGQSLRPKWMGAKVGFAPTGSATGLGPYLLIYVNRLGYCAAFVIL